MKHHEDIEKHMDSILSGYSSGAGGEFNWTYAVIGTFGAGKTQLLYHIFACALEEGLLPLYFIAEDLFHEVLIEKGNQAWLPAELDNLVLRKIERALGGLREENGTALESILHPRNDMAASMMDELVKRFSSKDVDTRNTVILVDELEGSYGNLQQYVQSKDRSPLKQWLEGKDYLKFVTLTPAGFDGMGSSDQTKVERIVL